MQKKHLMIKNEYRRVPCCYHFSNDQTVLCFTWQSKIAKNSGGGVARLQINGFSDNMNKGFHSLVFVDKFDTMLICGGKVASPAVRTPFVSLTSIIQKQKKMCTHQNAPRCQDKERHKFANPHDLPSRAMSRNGS